VRKSHVLLVDDEEHYYSSVKRALRRTGHQVSWARDASEAMAQVTAEPVELVLCDVKMPGISGLELVRQIREIQPELPCIVITGHGGAEASLDALRAGAYWYLEKGSELGHPDVLRRLVDQAIEHGRLKAENRHLQRQLQGRYSFESIAGASDVVHEMLRMIEKIADTDSTVLITGESGTGKELVARALHYNSSRAERMFVTVNCGAIPEELLESELFGHVKGAFTNAVNHREGRFALANGGTLFLDEIGDMSPKLQVKLLRVLQDGTFEPVGSSRTEHVDVRVLAATNQDLEQAIQAKRFREDLYYRLNVIPIHTPALRERRGDVPLLVRHFLQHAAEGTVREPTDISDAALDCLATHDWPGNVRELENLIERLVILCSDGRIELEDLPPELRRARAGAGTHPPRVGEEGVAFNEVVDRFESDLILQALVQTHWNKNQAAKLLGLNRTTLLEKIKKKGLTPDQAG